MPPAVRPRTSRWVAAVVATWLALLLPPAPADEPPATGAVDLKGGKIRDAATVVSFPISPDQSLVLGLHEGFWVQCPRYLPVPTCLSGQGLIVQWLNARGGTPTLLYVGVEPLPPLREGETQKSRLEREARAFADMLGARYKGVDFELLTPKVPLAPSTIKLGGKKIPVWRAGPYSTKPAGEYGGPRSVLVGSCVLFQPEGLDVLVYVALDMKSGGTTLERALADVSIQPTVSVNRTGRIVQLNDLFEGETGRFPVRLCSYEIPAGFVISPSVLKLDGELVYAEDRLDAQGRVTASWRMREVRADRASDPAADAADQRSSWGDGEASPLAKIPLSTPGVNAYAFTHVAKEQERTGRGHTAVVRFDDLTLISTWTTWGAADTLDPEGADKQRLAADAAAFESLLKGMQLAVRW